MEAQVNGVTLAYDIVGNGAGTPFVLLHGLAANRRFWDEVVTWLGDHGRVVAVDLRGRGQSSAPTCPGVAYTFDDHVADVRGLLRTLDVTRVRVMGHSLGGMVAQQLARDCPELVEALILVDTMSEVPDEARGIQRQRAEAIERHGVADEVEAVMQRWFTPADVQRRLPAIEQVRGWVLSGDKYGMAACYRASATWQFVPHLRNIHCPTLIIVGEQDPIATPAHARMMHEAISGSQLVVIPNAAHAMPLAQPELFRRAVEEFLARLRS